MDLEISDYGLIGNCRTAALVSRTGSIDWCCLPKFDSPSLFGRLLGENAGHFSLNPNGPFTSVQSYLGDTNVLVTRFQTSRGSAQLKDFFSVKKSGERPAQLWPDQEILRMIEVETGELEFALELFPRVDYGKNGLELRWIGNWAIQGDLGRKTLVLQTSLPKEQVILEKTADGGRVRSVFRLRAGERAVFSLIYADEAPAVLSPIVSAASRLKSTIDYWRDWSRRNCYQGPFQELVIRSALTLKLLHFAPSGAFLAAPTCSLPENPGGSRNWDYRFCWLRDASFTTRALISLGYAEEAKSFLNWLLHSTRLTWPRLQVVYTVYGEARIRESHAPWLSGFQGAMPVRIGNEASTQIQLDVYGEVIESFYELCESLTPIDRETQKMIIGFGKAVAQFWNQPDQGIWELRETPRHFTHSKLMCWVAMDRLCQLGRRLGWKLPFDAGQIADEIREAIEKHAFHPGLNAYTRAFGEPVLDASVLVMPSIGYCDPNSDRFRSTVALIARQLSRNGLIYRYPPGSDGISESEGSFNICNFWMAEALALGGCEEEARGWFEAIARSLNPLALSSEETNPETRSYLGNYPQGFSHIGLINAALAISRLEQRRKAA